MAADGATILKKMYTIQKNHVWAQRAWISCDSRGLMMCFPQGRALLSRLQGLKAKRIQLKISSGMIDSTELDTLAKHSQLLLSLCSTFCVSVFKQAALSPSLSGSVHLSLPFSIFPIVCLYHICFYFSWFLLSFTRSLFLSHSPFLDAEVHYVNMTALTKGHLLSSFWVVDRRHFYIGSASMDWRSLATVSKIHHASQHSQKHTHSFTHIRHLRKCNIPSCIFWNSIVIKINWHPLLSFCIQQIYMRFDYMNSISPNVQ